MASPSIAPAAAKKKKSSPPADTLEARCRSVIAANIERYPPEAFAIISEDSWDSIVQERNEKTRPSVGKGGLDGSGRLLPAVSAPFLLQVERLNPHLADSAVADRLAWKDCVEYSFHSGSISRPSALQYPWPLLVRKLTRSGEILMELLSAPDEQSDASRNQELFQRHVHALSESPMNVSLLQASGIGKAVKKCVKRCEKGKPETLNVDKELPVRGRHPASVKAAVSPLAMLKETLQRWKRMAANSGVQTSSDDAQGNQEDTSDQEDLVLAESCQSWRELYLVLKQREEERRAKQGERMRAIRQNLATGRPKVVKVRAAKSRHDSILDRADKKMSGARFGSSSAPAFAAAGGNAKMRALKKESRIATTLQKSSARPEQKKKASFGAAVAFATTTKSTKRRAGQQVVTMAGGKRMKIPARKASHPPFPSRR
jgi:hypothetical protein